MTFEDEVKQRAAELAARAHADATAQAETLAAAQAAARAALPRVQHLAQETARALSSGTVPTVAVAEMRPRRRLRLLGYGWVLGSTLVTDDGRLFVPAPTMANATVDSRRVVVTRPGNGRLALPPTPGPVYRWERHLSVQVAAHPLVMLTGEEWRSSPGTRPTVCTAPHQSGTHLTAGDDGEPALCAEQGGWDEPTHLERIDLGTWLLDAASRALASGSP